MKPGKVIAIVGVVLLVGIAGWKAFHRPKPAPEIAPIPTTTSTALPPQIIEEARPAPPVKMVKKPLAQKPVVPKTIVPIPSPPKPPSPQPELPVIPPPPAPLLEWQGSDTSVTHVGQVVVRNDRQWIRFWSEHHPHEAAPEIDFANTMVIGVFAGPRPAEQFTISILDVQPVKETLVVTYRERLPPPGTFAVNVTVYPYHLKVVPKSTLAVKFKVISPENVVR